MSEATPTLRIDRWLWAARAFKTRPLAAAACDGGKVTVNGSAAKAHKAVRPGDEIVITVAGDRRIWKVLGLSDRRGPATAARLLYEDHTPPPPPRDPGEPVRAGARPTKRDRRQMKRVFG